MQICDAVIVIYSDSAYMLMVRQKLKACWIVQKTQREQPFKVIALYNNDPYVDKLQINITLPNLHELDCPTPQTDTCLPRFVQMLTHYE
ncbi:MAG: hypothetical protein VSS75_028275 [Candidatus Parabeggiatoa sp.]|nr:hypothetical protein [Candidatus Parabeggiatoa sp.]